jgi:transcriptional regulator with GAF, ATPase, and Fis domain
MPPPPAPDESKGQRYVLLVVADGKFATHPLPDHGKVVIGRSQSSDVRIDDPSISRHHAALHIGDEIRVEDLGSANGTRLRDARLVSQSPVDSLETVELMDRRLDAGRPVEVSPGDVIQLGSTTVVVQHGAAGQRPRRLWAHGYFEGRLEEECARGERSRSSFAVARIHVEASAPRRAVEEVLAAATRSVDTVAAYGPGEYELLIVDADGPTASEVHQRIVTQLAGFGIEPRVGMAHFPQDGRSPESLLAKACARVRGPAEAGEAPLGPVVVLDPAMQRLHSLAERIADSTISVLLLGETGVGKDVLAETIHRRSPRAGKPFLRLNCAALSETLLESELFGHERGAFTGAVQAKPGLIETANGGTVFLDEIGELPGAIQAKLLRVLEDAAVLRVGGVKPRPINVRFMAATNRDLEHEVSAGAFREDLFFRISGVSLIIPPLRERAVEIEPMTRAFISLVARKTGRFEEPELGADALAMILQYAWPGNIRELRNVVERAMLLCGRGPITAEHLPVEKMGATLPARPVRRFSHPPPRPAWGNQGAWGALPAEPALTVPPPRSGEPITGRPPPGDVAGHLGAPSDEPERDRILRALEACAGNQTQAAKLLGISRRTLVTRLEQYRLPRPRKGGTLGA